MSAVEVLAGVDIVALRLSEEGALQVLLLRQDLKQQSESSNIGLRCQTYRARKARCIWGVL